MQDDWPDEEAYLDEQDDDWLDGDLSTRDWLDSLPEVDVDVCLCCGGYFGWAPGQTEQLCFRCEVGDDLHLDDERDAAAETA